MRSLISAALTGALLALPHQSQAISLDVNSPASIKSAAKQVAYGLVKYYKGNETGQVPGLLPLGYYWWEAGAMWGSLVNYWHYTGDNTYNSIVSEALQFQVGPYDDYLPPNQSSTEGNDDQAFWGFAVLNAAETNFPNPPSDKPSWLALAQAIFNQQTRRWDNATCGGGLRWQILPLNNGWTYKNTISNGCYFQIAARLGAYTGNITYFDYANRMWDWTTSIGIISSSYQVWDGTDVRNNCSDLNHNQWTYNVGVYLYGAAVMWNQTNGTAQEQWRQRISGLLDAAQIFFINDTMYEGCEIRMTCNTDQQSFKAYFARWLAGTVKVAPWTSTIIMPWLITSAQSAALSCSGGTDGITCGTKWTTGAWDNTYGVGQQMTALEVIQVNLLNTVAGPLANGTGATSVGDPGAGTVDASPDRILSPITTADKAGAGILTAIVLIGLLGGAWWMVWE